MKKSEQIVFIFCISFWIIHWNHLRGKQQTRGLEVNPSMAFTSWCEKVRYQLVFSSCMHRNCIISVWFSLDFVISSETRRALELLIHSIPTIEIARVLFCERIKQSWWRDALQWYHLNSLLINIKECIFWCYSSWISCTPSTVPRFRWAGLIA